jgi:hypothetical protein
MTEGPISIDMQDAQALANAWEKKGNPPCDNRHLAKERYRGTQTGDYVCTMCGASEWGKTGRSRRLLVNDSFR